jgi:hypothetical protein
VPARARNAEELVERDARALEYVAERAPVADDRVERRVPEAAQVDDVEDLARLDRVFDLRGALRVLREHRRRDVARDHRCAEPRQLEREASRARTRVEDAVAFPDELLE